MGPAILFCPADRPDRYGKAMDRADAVILDLEDAVAPQERGQARQHLIAHPMDPERTIVRINPAGTEDYTHDLRALQQTEYRYIMLAKTEDPQSLAPLADYLVIALCETAKGVINAAALAQAPNVVALMWGAEDLVASLGGTSSRKPDGSYRDIALHARSQVLLAARAAGKAPLDSVYLDIDDLVGLSAESDDAVATGFSAKVSIHPAQMQVIRKSFTPGPAEVERANRILAAAQQSNHGVFTFEGAMVDEPVLRHARRTLARAGLPHSAPASA
jgi:citrate lyase subunit beta/citryl-CoA lyase